MFLPFVIAATGIFFVCSAQQPGLEKMGGVGITVFKDKDFKGTTQTFQYDVSNLAGLGFNDEISSLRIGPGETWEICEHANYQGRCVAVTGEERDLKQNNWNDMISSFRRVGGGQPGPTPPTGDWYIVIFDQTNFRGNPTNYSTTQSNINKRAYSLTVGKGTWEICSGANFTGKCLRFASSVSDLNVYDFGGTVRSLKPVGAPTPPPTTNPYIVLFTNQNFQGTPTNYDSARSNTNKSARSITVGSGTWEICDGSNYSGRCITLSQSVSDLSTYNIGRTIQSVRPVTGPPMGSTEGWYIVLFTNQNFQGTPTNYDRSRSSMTKTARSVTVGMGVWDLCDGRNFSGRCITISQSVSDLSTYNISRTIRSVRPVPAQPR